MLALFASLALAQSEPPPEPPPWLERAHRDAAGLPTPYSRRVMARARLGNALLPAGAVVVGASTALAVGARGSRFDLWGPPMALGLGGMASGVALTAGAQERAAVDLRVTHEEPIALDALRVGHGMAITGGLGFLTGVGLAVGGVDDGGLFVAAGGLGLTALSAIPYGIHARTTRNAYLDAETAAPLAPSVTPIWDADRETAGVALSGRF